MVKLIKALSDRFSHWCALSSNLEDEVIFLNFYIIIAVTNYIILLNNIMTVV